MPKAAEIVILIIVVASAVIGVYGMYRSSTGKAFLPTPNIQVIPTYLGYCCCETQSHHLFEIYGNQISEQVSVQACQDLCDDHGSLRHPVTEKNVGKCGAA